MKKYLIPTALLLVTALSSCTKTINEDLSGNEHSLLELRVEGQMGTAIIDRDGSRATATVYILETPASPTTGFPSRESSSRRAPAPASGTATCSISATPNAGRASP